MEKLSPRHRKHNSVELDEGDLKWKKKSKSKSPGIADDKSVIPVDLTTDPPVLTPEQVTILKTTWALCETTMGDVGVITFLKVFETHPSVLRTFSSLKGLKLEDLETSHQLRHHALRAVGFVNKAINRIDNEEKLNSLILENGRHHFEYDAKPHYFELIAEQFIRTVEPTIREADMWTDETEKAWDTLFQLIIYRMCDGYYQEYTKSNR